MEANVQFVQQKKLERTKAALEKNNMQAFIVQTAAEVVPLLKTLLPQGGTVSNGGSVSLAECGALDLLKSGNYRYLDRTEPGVDVQKLYREVFSADAYLASANAVTEEGEVYQMDGNSNRVAPITFGPASVILVVGINKIVPDIYAAFDRRANIAAPANTHRLNLKTPCATTGVCSDCHSPDRVCCTEVILHQQRTKDRIKVILVNEALGY